MTIDKIHHRKLIRKFTAIGPYLRVLKSSETEYFFDCLAVCVSAKAAPEEREFWGWWLTLGTEDSENFEFHYQIGYFDASGQWQQRALPKKHEAEVARTLREFYDKLGVCMDELSLSVRPSPALGDNHLLSVA